MSSSRGKKSRAGIFAAIGLSILALGWVKAGAQEPAAAPAPNNGIFESEGIRYRFGYAGNVAQVPMQNTSGRLLMPVRINTGKPGFFLVATGDPRSAVDPKPWLPQDAAAGTIVDFSHTLFSVSGLEIQVENVLPASLVDLSDQIGEPIRGILSADILRQFVVELEYDRSAIHLYEPHSFQYTGKGIKLPLDMSNGVPHIRMKIGLIGHGSFEDEFAVQTEADQAISISKLYVASHHLRTNKMKGFSRTDANGKTLFTRIKSVSIGPFNMETPIVAFPPAGGPGNETGGVVGNALLSHFRVFLDAPHQQVILESSEYYRNGFEEDMSGVVVTAKGSNLKTFEVATVAPHTPGSEAGLQKGDVIAGIDGQPAADLTLSGVRELFKVFGHEYHLTVLRGDKTLEMKLKTKRLV